MAHMNPEDRHFIMWQDFALRERRRLKSRQPELEEAILLEKARENASVMIRLFLGLGDIERAANVITSCPDPMCNGSAYEACRAAWASAYTSGFHHHMLLQNALVERTLSHSRRQATQSASDTKDSEIAATHDPTRSPLDPSNRSEPRPEAFSSNGLETRHLPTNLPQPSLAGGWTHTLPLVIPNSEPSSMVSDPYSEWVQQGRSLQTTIAFTDDEVAEEELDDRQDFLRVDKRDELDTHMQMSDMPVEIDARELRDHEAYWGLFDASDGDELCAYDAYLEHDDELDGDELRDQGNCYSVKEPDACPLSGPTAIQHNTTLGQQPVHTFLESTTYNDPRLPRIFEAVPAHSRAHQSAPFSSSHGHQEPVDARMLREQGYQACSPSTGFPRNSFGQTYDTAKMWHSPQAPTPSPLSDPNTPGHEHDLYSEFHGFSDDPRSPVLHDPAATSPHISHSGENNDEDMAGLTEYDEANVHLAGDQRLEDDASIHSDAPSIDAPGPQGVGEDAEPGAEDAAEPFSENECDDNPSDDAPFTASEPCSSGPASDQTAWKHTDKQPRLNQYAPRAAKETPYVPELQSTPSSSSQDQKQLVRRKKSVTRKSLGLDIDMNGW
ncbi:unnamed protein product [Zymoseptoria tritici ST99CH_1E4]|uniref:Uncharacterized protein n=1 Tax=Zymoseptoria tritici ST99CH_1E4 TaxID=1276532 RepID=A0A2H1G4H1_ZYMTR|nr:unnamed protein product [Zymoseptoria tritici ST99CH_1E4]